MEFAEVERSGERLYLPGFGGDFVERRDRGGAAGGEGRLFHGARRRRLRRAVPQAVGRGGGRPCRRPHPARRAHRHLLHFVWTRRASLQLLPRRLGGSPGDAGRAAARHDRRRPGVPSLGHQPGDLARLRRRGLCRDPPCQGERHGRELRHQSAASPVAARPRPRRHPRGARARRHRPAEHRRRAPAHGSRSAGGHRRLLPAARLQDRRLDDGCRRNPRRDAGCPCARSAEESRGRGRDRRRRRLHRRLPRRMARAWRSVPRRGLRQRGGGAEDARPRRRRADPAPRAVEAFARVKA